MRGLDWAAYAQSLILMLQHCDISFDYEEVDQCFNQVVAICSSVDELLSVVCSSPETTPTQIASSQSDADANYINVPEEGVPSILTNSLDTFDDQKF